MERPPVKRQLIRLPDSTVIMAATGPGRRAEESPHDHAVQPTVGAVTSESCMIMWTFRLRPHHDAMITATESRAGSGVPDEEAFAVDLL